MGGFSALAQLISMDVTNVLVGNGLAYATLSVTNATNATPIVLTLATPHNIQNSSQTATVVVGGVGGNTAANGTWLAQLLDATHIALLSVNTLGVQAPVAGNGAYTSGGTVQTAFADGQILVGRVHVPEYTNTPRVIFVPKSSKFGPRVTPNANPVSAQNKLAPGTAVKSFTMTAYGGGYAPTDTVTISAPDIAGGIQATAVPVFNNGGVIRVLPTNLSTGYVKVPTVTFVTSTGSGAAATANLAPTTDSIAQSAQRGIWTEEITFEVQVWQAALTPSYELDFDAAQALYRQVLVSTWLRAPGQVKLTSGQWLTAGQTAGQVDIRGQVFVFDMTILTPITDAPFAQAGPQVRPSLTNQMIAIDTGTIETGFSGLG